MAVTLRDVARHAGVSPRTVSNVVNDFALVSDEMRARVQRAIEETGYRPNLVARNLRRGRSGLLALALPELRIPYFSDLASLIIEEADRHAYTVVIEQTNGRLEDEQRLLLRNDRALLFDGVILSPVALGDADLSKLSSDTPIVLLGERIKAGAFDHAGIDNVAAARCAVEHLASLGRRRIAAIGSDPEMARETALERTQGYRQGLEDAGLPFDPALVPVTPAYYRKVGTDIMSALLDLDGPPDAVFCFNDLLAAGAMRAISSRGLRIPDDIAVVGFDDIEESRYSLPSLTTISPDNRRIAAFAVERLVSRLNGDKQPPISLDVDFTLKIRESTIDGQLPTEP